VARLTDITTELQHLGVFILGHREVPRGESSEFWRWYNFGIRYHRLSKCCHTPKLYSKIPGLRSECTVYGDTVPNGALMAGPLLGLNGKSHKKFRISNQVVPEIRSCLVCYGIFQLTQNNIRMHEPSLDVSFHGQPLRVTATGIFFKLFSRTEDNSKEQ
jgi:hypothetical protein